MEKRITGKKQGDIPNITKIIFMKTSHCLYQKNDNGDLLNLCISQVKSVLKPQKISGNFRLYQWNCNIKIRKGDSLWPQLLPEGEVDTC